MAEAIDESGRSIQGPISRQRHFRTTHGNKNGVEGLRPDEERETMTNPARVPEHSRAAALLRFLRHPVRHWIYRRYTGPWCQTRDLPILQGDELRSAPLEGTTNV